MPRFSCTFCAHVFVSQRACASHIPVLKTGAGPERHVGPKGYSSISRMRLLHKVFTHENV